MRVISVMLYAKVNWKQQSDNIKHNTQNTTHDWIKRGDVLLSCSPDTIWHEMLFNVRSKADISQFNLPHATKNNK